MCLSPIAIRNRSKYFNRTSFHKYVIDVPCGKCAECVAASQNEYYLRTYYECLNCWESYGYVLFDTLTYDDEHLPHMSDFIDDVIPEFDYPCFDYRDIRLFLVNLRRQLDYHGFDSKNNLKYFICSEYGADPRYTHRPHYHVLFFVKSARIDPITLSKFINKCWSRGRTDGVDYQGSGYVLQKRVFWKSDELHARCVSNYVGKYITKDSEFVSEINKRLKNLRTYVYAKQISAIYDVEFFDLFGHEPNFKQIEQRIKSYGDVELSGKFDQWLKDLKRHVSQFHRQSQGYGLYMIDAIGKDYIFEHNNVYMPDSQLVKKILPVPQYILGKLFKEKKIDNRTGDVYYGWSEYGNEFRLYHSLERDREVVKNVKNFFTENNLLQVFQNEYVVKEILEEFERLLDGRTVEEYCDYISKYKGRIQFDVDNLFDYDIDSYMFVDQHEFDDGDEVIWRESEELDDFKSRHRYVISEETCYEFRNFDALFCLYNKVKKKWSGLRQAKFEEDMRMQALFKKYGLKFKNK